MTGPKEKIFFAILFLTIFLIMAYSLYQITENANKI